MEPEYLNDLLTEVLGCACETLNNFSDCGCPCRMFISAGRPVADIEACCTDGQLTVHVDRIYSFNQFPAQSAQVNLCQTPLAVDVVVTLYRCFPVLKDDGSAPTPIEIQAATESIYKDQYVLTNGLLCCLSIPGRRRKFVFRGSQIIEPQGGCIGVQLDFTVEIADPVM